MATTEERKKLLEKKFVESRPPLAYAKLSGRLGEDDVFEMLLTHMPVEIGRGPVSTFPGPRISLGEQKAISRQHARIQWNTDKSCFELHCIGKNGLFAAGKFVAKDKSVDLVSRMPLKIGPARLYFLTAIRSTCSTMSGFKMMQRAFEKIRNSPSATLGLSVEEIVQQIMNMFPRSEAELGGRENLRNFVANYVVEDEQNFELVADSQPPRYRMKQVASITNNKSGSSTATTTVPTMTDSNESANKKQRIMLPA